MRLKHLHRIPRGIHIIQSYVTSHKKQSEGPRPQFLGLSFMRWLSPSSLWLFSSLSSLLFSWTLFLFSCLLVVSLLLPLSSLSLLRFYRFWLLSLLLSPLRGRAAQDPCCPDVREKWMTTNHANILLEPPRHSGVLLFCNFLQLSLSVSFLQTAVAPHSWSPSTIHTRTLSPVCSSKCCLPALRKHTQLTQANLLRTVFGRRCSPGIRSGTCSNHRRKESFSNTLRRRLCRCQFRQSPTSVSWSSAHFVAVVVVVVVVDVLSLQSLLLYYPFCHAVRALVGTCRYHSPPRPIIPCKIRGSATGLVALICAYHCLSMRCIWSYLTGHLQTLRCPCTWWARNTQSR